ncbi:VOC family protein [Pelagibius sp. Alg239-R121]|uniref:VOC family protein n=1 Tax=Pelagibius sp. Alg239-R121 TaxID=2993448 RepID=UPI0024A75930|nr:VOC family protein [Pelagibius sp. Alg239-R121]
MTLRLERIVIFVSDLDKEAAFYRDKLGLPVCEEREGWVAFDAGSCEIALHRGKRKPRLDFATGEALENTYEQLRGRGVRLGEIKAHPVRDNSITRGRDPEGNPFQIAGQKS